MNIEINVRPIQDLHRINIKVNNGLCDFEGFDVVSDYALEDIATQLTNAVQTLYDYRKKLQENSHEKEI